MVGFEGSLIDQSKRRRSQRLRRQKLRGVSSLHLSARSSADCTRELSKAAEPFIKQEDEGKFRCKTCQKLFKATSFVEKHIANKHPELVKHLEEVGFFCET